MHGRLTFLSTWPSVPVQAPMLVRALVPGRAPVPGIPFVVACLIGVVLCAGALSDVYAQRSARYAEAHAVLDGVVVDATTGTPLPGAHVFIAQTMKGTTADAEGRFELDGVRLGARRLYASMLGYEPHYVDLFLQRDTTYTFALRLEPTVIEGQGVTVEAERDPDWYDRLERFERMFLGPSEWAEACTIENPEVLRFETRWYGRFRAWAAEPLIITNRALGYRIRYYLDEFEASGGVLRWDGEPLFESLNPSSEEESHRWARNREAAYRGSLRHFLRALMNDRLDEEDFLMYRIPRASAFRHPHEADRFLARRDRLLTLGADSTYRLDFRGRLEIIYRGEGESSSFLRWSGRAGRPGNVQTSQMRLNDPPVRLDRYGKIVEPYGATVYQYFAFERLAELVPLEYEPDGVEASLPLK